MQIELRDEVVNGTGTNVYAVAVIAFDGKNLGTAIWCADDEEHLEEQLMKSFIDDVDWEMCIYSNQNITPDWRSQLIGNTLK